MRVPVTDNPFSVYLTSTNISLIFSKSINDACQATVLSTTPSKVITRQPARQSRLPRIYFTTMGTLQGTGTPVKRSVTWEEWKELVSLFEQLSIQTTPQPGHHDSSRPKYAIEIDFAFTKSSAIPSRSRTSARTPLSVLHNFNQKPCSDNKVEIPPTIMDLLDPRVNTIQPDTAVSVSSSCYTNSNVPQSLGMFWFTGPEIREFITANSTLLASTIMVKDHSRTSKHLLRNYGRPSVYARHRNDTRLPAKAETNEPAKLAPCFSNLPIELRLMCYEFARPEARVVKLSLSKHHKPDDWSPCLYSGAVVPNLLHWYEPSSGPQRNIDTRTQRARHARSFYFDQSEDYLYVQCNKCRGSGCDSSDVSMCGVSMLSLAHRQVRQPVKRLLIEFAGTDMVLWHPLIWYPNSEHVKCIHWENGLLFRHEAKLSDFIEVESQYHWQQGKTMQECFDTQRSKTVEDELGQSLRGVKSFSEVALRQPNTLSDVLEDTKVQWLKRRAA
ncbi:hypothetical protein DL98DRAFT_573972 [Cadophora sp. DSE1049]|nr:hypothetical protein DL98DRAFT_573972 [Cadophora sp. DSE1049]